MLSGGEPGDHSISRIGPGFVTAIFERNRQYVDEVVKVSTADALATARQLALVDSLMVRPPVLAAAQKPQGPRGRL